MTDRQRCSGERTIAIIDTIVHLTSQLRGRPHTANDPDVAVEPAIWGNLGGLDKGKPEYDGSPKIPSCLDVQLRREKDRYKAMSRDGRRHRETSRETRRPDLSNRCRIALSRIQRHSLADAVRPRINKVASLPKCRQMLTIDHLT